MNTNDIRGVGKFRFHTLWFKIALLLFPIVLAAGGEHVTQLLCYDRAGIAQGQWWRLWTGHWVHLGWIHVALNLAGAMLLGLLCADRWSNRLLAWRILFLSLVVSVGLYLFMPELNTYVGLSGILHGLIVWGMIDLAIQGDRIAALALFVIAGKLIWENIAGPSSAEEQLIGGSIVSPAHLYGALGACAGWCLERLPALRSKLESS